MRKQPTRRPGGDIPECTDKEKNFFLVNDEWKNEIARLEWGQGDTEQNNNKYKAFAK